MIATAVRTRSVYLAGKISEASWRQIILDSPSFRSLTLAGPTFVDVHDHNIWRPNVVEQCFGQIDRAEMVFAWIDRAHQYGTMAELGYAAAKSKPIYIGFPTTENDSPWTQLESDMWFATALPNAMTVYGYDPLDAFNEALDFQGWSHHFQSPLEESFWKCWQEYFRACVLTPQYKVLGGRYRLDFAHVETLTAIELDGVSYHGDDVSFQRDRKRDRELTQLGWTTIRFTGNEIRSDVTDCVFSAHGIIQAREK